MNKRVILFFVLSFLHYFVFSALAITTGGRLFQFERSTNKNYICYDVNLKSKKDNEVTIHLSPYKNLPIRILKRGGKWIALVTMEGQEMIVSRFFAQMKGESLTCLYVDVTGTTSNGKTVTKRINNKK